MTSNISDCRLCTKEVYYVYSKAFVACEHSKTPAEPLRTFRRPEKKEEGE